LLAVGMASMKGRKKKDRVVLSRGGVFGNPDENCLGRLLLVRLSRDGQ
jgi:hypothetical protein